MRLSRRPRISEGISQSVSLVEGSDWDVESDHLNMANTAARIADAINRPIIRGIFQHMSPRNGVWQCMHFGSMVGVARPHFMQMRRGAVRSRLQKAQRDNWTDTNASRNSYCHSA